jgi:release factor glutamine methyltransferase
MLREQALRQATRTLEAAAIDTPALDARLLLQQALGVSHASLIASAQAEMNPSQLNAFNTLITRRAAREPVSRILGSREFHGLNFTLAPDTLDPRADTETLVTTALTLAGGQQALRILDLGTGSGAIIVSLLHALPSAEGTATDISQGALDAARANAIMNGVSDRLELVQSDWFAQLHGKFDLIVSNPPYIPDQQVENLSPEVRLHDPHLALKGGPDGLAAYRVITQAAPAHLKPSGHMLFEIGQGQERDVAALLAASGFTNPTAMPSQQADLAGIIRVIVGRFPG